jgi:hypothetical protein
MPRINWRSIEREEQAIDQDATLTPAEKNRRIEELHRDLREEYLEQQREEMREEFGE